MGGQRSALTRKRPLSRRSQRRPATLSPKGSASMSPSWCPCSSLLRSVLTSPRRSAPGPAPTQGRSRSLWSRSGVTSPLLSPASPKCLDDNAQSEPQLLDLNASRHKLLILNTQLLHCSSIIPSEKIHSVQALH